MNQQQFYKHICQKYPNVKYNGEDLNMYNMYAKEVFKRWHNVERYPKVSDIMNELRLSERTIYRLAKDNNMGSRWQIHKLNK
jgi:hypothetical protein